jgi:hypothetical protein
MEQITFETAKKLGLLQEEFIVNISKIYLRKQNLIINE